VRDDLSVVGGLGRAGIATELALHWRSGASRSHTE
jgi:hypothetical protein